jgi:hypothetical protein
MSICELLRQANRATIFPDKLREFRRLVAAVENHPNNSPAWERWLDDSRAAIRYFESRKMA